MAIYRAQFRWTLPSGSATVARFAEVLSNAVGYPCRVTILREASSGVVAALSLPRIARNNAITLSSDLCELEFAPLPFFWAHATRSIQELGGAFLQPVMSDLPDWRPRRWSELKWGERGRILLGMGASVR
jgi:hypothetical protein